MFILFCSFYILSMNEIYISSYRLIQDIKPYYVYKVELIVHDLGLHKTVERRYSAFRSLHRELRKHFRTPPFPPKRVRCSQLKVLEQRRQGLEQYLQAMFQFPPSKGLVIAFLGIPSLHTFAGKNKNFDHQPIFRIIPVTDALEERLPNIISNGVLNAVYGHN